MRKLRCAVKNGLTPLIVAIFVVVALLRMCSGLAKKQETSEERNGAPQRENRSVDDDVVDLIYEHTKEAPNILAHDSEQLDTKIAAVFAAATVAVGFMTRLPDSDALTLSLSFAGMPQRQVVIVDILVCLALVAWGLVAYTTLMHLKTKKHRRSLRAAVLWSKHRTEPSRRIKTRLIKDIRKASIHNADVLAAKAKTFNRVVWYVALEGAFIVLAIVLTRFSG